MRVSFSHCAIFKEVAGRARLLSPLLLLFTLSPIPAWGQSALINDTLVIVDFPAPACDSFWPALEFELAHSKTTDLLGGSVVWMRQSDFRGGMQFKQIYQIRLRGDCTMAAP